MDEATKNLIQDHIDNNEVCLFMKGTPDAPQCGFFNGCFKHVKNSRSKF